MIYAGVTITMRTGHRSRIVPAVQSMTAFARREGKYPWGSLSWELRSVNHRYLEAQLRLPESARQLEMPARERLRERLGRGKVDCTLRLHAATTASGPLVINEETLEQLHAAITRIHRLTGGLTTPSALDLLHWPGVLAEQHVDDSDVARAALGLLDDTLDELLAMRTREGAMLAEQIEQRLASIEGIVREVRAELPRVIAAHRQRLLERIAELRVELDAERIEQEVALLVSRSDVAEELDRLESHVREARHSLAQGGACGRRLDFLMQEFNREANTLASKSIAAQTTRSAVELKVLIEQAREQVQNIE